MYRAPPKPAATLRFQSDLDFSLVGRELTAHSGIAELMNDLGRALTGDARIRMLGGGNPGAVPEFQELLRQRMRELLDEHNALSGLVGNYEPPQGNPRFLRALAELLRVRFGWDVGPENIAVTCGGQTACFFLFNVLAGHFGGGRQRKVLLPLSPEYIGYADQGLEPDLFVACPPEIQWPAGVGEKTFKYRINFAAVEEALRRHDIGVIALSRPTNPSGNVVTDAEVLNLSELAAARGIPLLLDSAYGQPFPGILHVEARPFWSPWTILTLSLSKLGLPGTRTGIVIGPKTIVSAIASCTAIVGLANNPLGQRLVLPWIEDGTILELGPRLLRPFYAAKRQLAMGWAREYLDAAGLDWALHANEGAFFLWLWLKNPRLSVRDLYERLKARQVLIVPGEYFFYGLEEDWPHARQCLRVNYAGEAETVREGLQIIADEAAKVRS